jgi:hypothetical protein
VLPDLAAIECKYAGAPFTVVGVHSAKFDNEKDSEAIRSAGGEGRAGTAWRCMQACINMCCRHVLGGVGYGVSGTMDAAPHLPYGACLWLSAVLRYEIDHPVVNDGNMTLWRELGVSSWPTLAVMGPGGRTIAMLAGEGHRQDIDDIVAAALEVSA